MTYEMTLLENRMAGFAEGHAEGRAEERENFAFKMLLDGMSISKIQEWTKLSIERIKEIAAENSIALKVN